MKRYLEKFIKKDLEEKIVFVSGPRQVGKTTLSKQLFSEFEYFNYDSASDREIIWKSEWNRNTPVIIFDELHKMKNWKSWLKGVFDTEGIPPAILITGSAKLDTYRKSGDSLAGRFFSYRLHPVTVKEASSIIGMDPDESLKRLLNVGGFPEPFLKNSETFAKRWRRSHTDIIIREDLLDLENVRDIKSMEILIDLIGSRVGSPTSYSSLATDLQVSIHTVKHWLQILENLYIVFPVRPYHKNIARSILKEPKYYLYDSGAVRGDIGSKIENIVATAILRELHFIEDTTGCKVSLYYLRDKEKREVDFLAIVDDKPVLMVEVKTSDDNFSKSLLRFSNILKPEKSYQVVYNLKKKKSRPGIDMIQISEFLNTLDLG